ncbi:MAG: hypothetical protein FWG28_06615 [Clostridiales bacterium]|nr:hypothetical protein [Clostridiales bacterium]
MKKIKLILVNSLTITLTLALIACGSSKDLSLIKDIASEHISIIKVSTLPTLFDSVELTDTNEIENIALYLEGLNPGKSSMNDAIGGMAYLIEIFYDDDTETKVVISGNKYISINNNAAHTIPYDEATVFDTVIGDILLKQYHNQYRGTIVKGKILSVSSATSGSSIACEIQTDDNSVMSVSLNNARHIIDITGTGRLILLVGDEVEIGIDDNNVADQVFITNNARI